jgi:CBS domain-containing protein
MSNFGVLDNRFLSKSIGLLNPSPPVCLPDSSTIKSALEIFKREKIGCVICVDDAGKVSGIFSERDVVLKVVLSDLAVNHVRISEVMTKNPQTATMTTSVAFALNMMSQGGFRHIPVVDEEAYPVGLISVKDLVDHVANTVVKDLLSFSA